jgi:hypothetical protein
MYPRLSWNFVSNLSVVPAARSRRRCDNHGLNEIIRNQPALKRNGNAFLRDKPTVQSGCNVNQISGSNLVIGLYLRNTFRLNLYKTGLNPTL